MSSGLNHAQGRAGKPPGAEHPDLPGRRAARSQAARLRSFIYFAALSGLGWLFDMFILLMLVGWFGMPVFAANVISSTCAALSVFLVSRLLVFDADKHALGARIAVYAAYTLCVIVVAAAALQEVATLLRGLAAANGVAFGATAFAAAAKIIVTPPQLLLNFVVAGYTSERPIRRVG